MAPRAPPLFKGSAPSSRTPPLLKTELRPLSLSPARNSRNLICSWTL